MLNVIIFSLEQKKLPSCLKSGFAGFQLTGQDENQLVNSWKSVYVKTKEQTSEREKHATCTE